MTPWEFAGAVLSGLLMLFSFFGAVFGLMSMGEVGKEFSGWAYTIALSFVLIFLAASSAIFWALVT